MTFSENHFIQEGYRKDPYPLKFWSILVTLSIIVIYQAAYLAEDLKLKTWQTSPFLRVTNRELSLFLWQHPQLMRVHAKNKIGYLPGFQYLHKINMDLETSEGYVTVPPSILFQYHAWNRLLSDYLPDREITLVQFKEFLKLVSEWHPDNWLEAPKEYLELVQHLDEINEKNLQRLSYRDLPVSIRQAFYGWKNYFKEGDAINAMNPTAKQIDGFLRKYPNYNKNYWKNIYPNYLKSFSLDNWEVDIPKEEIPPFLRVALYNELLFTNPSE